MKSSTRTLRLGIITALVLLVESTAASAQVTIDTFAVAQSGTGTLDTGTVVGGERDIREVSGAAAVVAAGSATCTGNFLSACVFVYDGNDDDPAADRLPGFSPINFTANGQDRFRVPTTLTSGSCALTIGVCDGGPNCSSLATGLITTGTPTFLFSSFPAVDFGSITFVAFNLAPQSSPSTCSLGPSATTPVELLEFSVE